jgi:spermidine/putrescine transport system permease protein
VFNPERLLKTVQVVAVQTVLTAGAMGLLVFANGYLASWLVYDRGRWPVGWMMIVGSTVGAVVLLYRSGLITGPTSTMLVLVLAAMLAIACGHFWESIRERWLALLFLIVFFSFTGWVHVADSPDIQRYLRTLVRSVNYAAITTVVCLAAGYPVAYFIGTTREKNRNLLLMLVMIPFWTSFLIRTYAWMTILAQEGLMNALLVDVLGVLDSPIKILYTPLAVIIGLVYTYLPFMILPIYGSVEKLDNSLVEAAFDLGAGPVRAFQQVIVPLTQPGIVAGVLLVFIPSIGMFAISDLMGGGSVPMIGNIISNQFVGRAGDWPLGAALGITLLVMFVLCYFAMNRRDSMAG